MALWSSRMIPRLGWTIEEVLGSIPSEAHFAPRHIRRVAQ